MNPPRNERLSRLGFGCARIGSFNNPMSAADSQRLLAQALDRGITLFDTADIYGQGDSERAVGRLLRGRRDVAFVVTKVGQRFSTAMRLVRPFKPVLRAIVQRAPAVRSSISERRAHVMRTDFSARYVTRAIDASLRRLRLETIDALLLHSPAAHAIDPALDATLDGIRTAGKIRNFGVACDDVASVEAALRLPNLGFIEVAPPVLDAAQGVIEGAVASRGLEVLVREVIRNRGSLSPKRAVGDMMGRPGVASVIVGTTSAQHLDHLAELLKHRTGEQTTEDRPREITAVR